MDGEEHEPFLPAKDESRAQSDHSSSSTTPPKFLARFRGWRGGVLVHIVLVLIYTIVSIAAIRAARNSDINSFRPPCKQASSMRTRPRKLLKHILI